MSNWIDFDFHKNRHRKPQGIIMAYHYRANAHPLSTLGLYERTPFGWMRLM